MGGLEPLKKTPPPEPGDDAIVLTLHLYQQKTPYFTSTLAVADALGSKSLVAVTV